MFSIVSLVNDGGLNETGAGCSAAKHVQQFSNAGHLRWDSLGENCALVPSLELVVENSCNRKATILADTLDEATATYPENGRLPFRNVNEIDNRGSSLCLALSWALALDAQTDDAMLQERFSAVAAALGENETTIVEGLLVARGSAVDVSGYCHPNDELTEKAMRPSAISNAIIDGMVAPR